MSFLPSQRAPTKGPTRQGPKWIETAAPQPGNPRRPCRWHRSPGWLVIALLVGMARLLAADAHALPEPQLKALYLYNFTKYVDWPAESFAGTNAPFTIGVVGGADVGHALEEIVRGKRVNGRELVVRRIEQPEEVKACQVVFLDPKDRPLASFISAAKDLPVLTVGIAEDFLGSGGMVCLARKDQNIRPRIDLPTARRVHLNISAKLLALAEISDARPEGGKH